MFHELFTAIRLAWHNLQTNLGRTMLTLVGVVIGITSVIVVTSSGQGVKSFVLGQVASFGTDVIQVETKVPATGKTSTANAQGQAQGIQITTLTIDDAEAVKKLSNVEDVYAGSIGQALASYRRNNKQILLFGAGASVPIVDPGVKIAEGSFYSEEDDRSLAQVMVIGSEVKKSLFGEDEAIGKTVKLNDQPYKVVGLLESRGTTGFFNLDNFTYVPVRTLQKKIQGVNHIRMFTVKVKDESLIPATAEDIIALIRDRHDITDPNKDDFSVTSIKEAQDMIAKVFGAINILLLALTSISLLVGGVGIMNVMYVAVVERTFEIGLRKAVGAKPGDILKQFLWEAIFITVAGGLVGIVLGIGFSTIISLVIKRFGYDLTLVVTPGAVMLATGFSVAVGIIFGYYPARKAALLTPIEALRKE